MRRLIQTAAALVAAVVAYTAVTLPPRRLQITSTLPANIIVGAYHVHTTLSDGAGTPEEVAAAAEKAKLKFVIFTDHGDGTRMPAPPRYVNGVLLIDAAEISTVEGHVVALGLHAATPYRLGGEARDVIDDIHRLGGFAIVAHPDSRRDDLRWRPIMGTAPNSGFGGRQGGTGPNASNDLSGADGLEWINADSEWRDESKWALVNAVLHLPVRGAETLASLFGRPTATMRRWDGLARRRTMIGLAAVDAHGVISGLYRKTFESLQQAVVLDAPLTNDAAADAARVLGALRAGRAFSVIGGLADAAAPIFRAQDVERVVSFGEHLTMPAGDVRIEASVPGASGSRVVIMRDDRVMAEGMGQAVMASPAEPGVYRLEVWLGSRRIPWIVTNPIYIDPPPRPVPAASLPQAMQEQRPNAAERALPFDAGWVIEHGATSGGTVTGANASVAFDWQMGTSEPTREFAAVVHGIADNDAFDRVEFTASAPAPTRLTVQFRMPYADDERWARSIYVDSTPRPVTVRMSDLTPQGFSTNRRPIAAKVKAILFVLDPTNTAPGSKGELRLENVRLLRSGESGGSGPNR